MLDPVANAVEAFLVVYNNIPGPVRFFISLCFLLFLIPLIVRLVLSFRG